MEYQEVHQNQRMVRPIDLLTITLAYVASQVFFRAAGWRFDHSLIYFTMHLLDPELLRTRLLESVWYMHMQPPIFNLFTGWGLKLFPQAYPTFFSGVFLMLGLGMSWAMYWLARSLGVGRKLALGAIVLYVIGPADMFFRNWYFYSYPVMAMLVFSAGLLYKYLSTGQRNWGWAFFGMLTMIMLTRYSYHFVWFLALTAGLFLLLQNHRRQIVRMALVPALICIFWMAKNYYLFGTFSMSSWLGWSLSKVTSSFLTPDELDSLEAEGKVSSLARIWPGNRFEFYEDFLRKTGQLYHPAPALQQRVRSTAEMMNFNVRNFNNIDYLVISRQYTLDSLAVIRHRPAAYFRGLRRSATLFFLPVRLIYDEEPDDTITAYHRFWTLLGGSWGQPAGVDMSVLRDLSVTGPQVCLLVVLFFILAPAVFVSDLLRKKGLARLGTARLVTVGFMLFNLLYVSATGILLDFGENNRFRSEIVPLSVVLAAVMLQRFADGRNRGSLTGRRN